VSGLNIGKQRSAGDDGAPDPHVAAALSAYAAGQGSEQAALAALSRARLLVPLVEREAGADEPCVHAAHPGEHAAGCDHHAAKEMAFPTLIGHDGRRAVLAFTSLAALAGWRGDARPVPAEARQVWSTAAGDSCAVVIDVAGPVPLAVDGARLAALAAGDPPPSPYADPDVRAQVMAALADEPAIVGADLAEGPPGTDLAVRLTFGAAAPGGAGVPEIPAMPAGRGVPGVPGVPAGPGVAGAEQPAVPDAVYRAAEAIAGRLAGRLRRGIEITAAPVSR
jgi:hypothetical protein